MLRLTLSSWTASDLTRTSEAVTENISSARRQRHLGCYCDASEMTLVQVSDRISDDISLADACRVPETETIMIDRVDVSDMIVWVAVQ